VAASPSRLRPKQFKRRTSQLPPPRFESDPNVWSGRAARNLDASPRAGDHNAAPVGGFREAGRREKAQNNSMAGPSRSLPTPDTPDILADACARLGRCGSLFLHRSGLAPPTPCRSPRAPDRKPRTLKIVSRLPSASSRIRTPDRHSRELVSPPLSATRVYRICRLFRFRRILFTAYERVGPFDRAVATFESMKP
jgi:hypothetical protein